MNVDEQIGTEATEPQHALSHLLEEFTAQVKKAEIYAVNSVKDIESNAAEWLRWLASKLDAKA